MESRDTVCSRDQTAREYELNVKASLTQCSGNSLQDSIHYLPEAHASALSRGTEL